MSICLNTGSCSCIGPSIHTTALVVEPIAGGDIALEFQGHVLSMGPVVGPAQGEANTGSNVGGGAEVFRDKAGAVLNFRTLVGTGGVNVAENGDTIEIDTGGGLTDAEHESLLQIIHFIDQGPTAGFATGATKTVTGGAFPTQILWERSDSTRLVEQNITYTGILPTTVEWKLYAANGTTVLETVTDTVSYSGPFETGRTRAIA